MVVGLLVARVVAHPLHAWPVGVSNPLLALVVAVVPRRLGQRAAAVWLRASCLLQALLEGLLLGVVVRGPWRLLLHVLHVRVVALAAGAWPFDLTRQP